MFSAYTIKKVLPRLVIATIAIQLSWWLCVEIVNINNAVAHGIEGLLYAPFGGVEKLSLKSILEVAGGNALQGYTEAAGVAAISFVGISLAAGPSTALGVLALAGTAILGAFIALFTLVMRRVVLIALIVTAPIGIVAWVLPGTQKLWKIWWESFSKLLMMYPLILLIIAAGRIFAYVAASTSGNNDLFTFLIITIAFFGPYFLIPATLKLSGAAFATITGVVNSRGKGAFDRLRNVRSSEAQKTWQKTKNYERFGDSNRLARGASTAFGVIGTPRDVLGGRSRIRAGKRAGITNLGAENWKNDQTIQANQNDDNFLLALANEGLAKAKIEAARGKLADARAANDQVAIAKAESEIAARQGALDNAKRVSSRNSSATRMAATMALARTGYQFSAGQAGYTELSDTIRSITGGDDQAYSSAMNEAQYHLKGSGGRSDLGGINHGHGGEEESVRAGIKTGFRKVQSYQRGQSKSEAYTGAGQAWLGTASGTDSKSADAVHRDLVAGLSTSGSGITTDGVAEYHRMLLKDKESATDANREVIDAQLGAIERLILAPDATGATVDQIALSNSLRNNRIEARRQNIDPSELET